MKVVHDIEINNYRKATPDKLDKVIKRDNRSKNSDDSGVQFEAEKLSGQSYSKTVLPEEIKLIKFCIEQIGRNVHFFLWM